MSVLSKKSLSLRPRSSHRDEDLSAALKKSRQLMQDPLFANLAVGQNEWVNIQTVLRSAIQTLHNSLTLQNECLGNLVRNGLTKSDEEDLLERIGQKADGEELKGFFGLLSEKIQMKADLRDLEALENNLVSRSAFLDHQKAAAKKMFEVESLVLGRVAAKDFDAQRDATNAELTMLKAQMKKMEAEVEHLRSQATSHSARSDSWDRRVKNSEAILRDLKPVLKNCVSKAEMAEAMKEKLDCVS